MRAVRGRAVLLLLLGAAPAAAQQPVEVEPQHVTRTLGVGQLARFGGETEATAGLLYQRSLTPSRIELAPTGGRIEHPPRLYLHALATAGAGTGDDLFRATAQLGIIRRNDHHLLTASGIAAQALLAPRALGPVARAELLDNVGLQVGWLFRRHGGDGVYLSIDYMRDILSDLGLTP